MVKEHVFKPQPQTEADDALDKDLGASYTLHLTISKNHNVIVYYFKLHAQMTDDSLRSAA